MNTPISDSQRVWMITGASRGFGARIARAALVHGDAVVATARDPAAIDRGIGQHPMLLSLGLDVTDAAQAAAVVRSALDRFGRIDVLVNNAGYGLLGAVEEATDDEIRRLYETNVFGLLKVTRAVLPAMRERRSGRIINFSSIGAIRASAGFGLYCSTKFAVEGISEALSAELSPLGIHVTAIQPGYFRTDFLEGTSLVTSPRIIESYSQTAGQVRLAAARISGHQPGDPSKLADAVLALAQATAPPLHLPLGSDCLNALAEKLQRVGREAQDWHDLCVSTDF